MDPTHPTDPTARADKRCRLSIRGRVQGVGFRWFTLTAARTLGLVGWVRNEVDGSVLCEAQGAAADVDAFVQQVRAGPRFARVAELTVVEQPPGRGETGFEITG